MIVKLKPMQYQYTPKCQILVLSSHSAAFRGYDIIAWCNIEQRLDSNHEKCKQLSPNLQNNTSSNARRNFGKKTSHGSSYLSTRNLIWSFRASHLSSQSCASVCRASFSSGVVTGSLISSYASPVAEFNVGL